MSVYPRKRLLRDIADPDIRVWSSLLACDKGNSYVQVPDVSRRKVTATIAELRRRDWVRLGEAGDGMWSVVRWWELTPAGRAVLAKAAAA